MKTCTTLRGLRQPDGSVKEKPCKNRVLPFVDQQPADQCYSCFLGTEGPSYETGSGYEDKNDGGVPK